MYSPADLTAMMALQQQQQQQHDESADDLQARALKRPRLVWTPQLHKKFEEAVQKIGLNKAVPKTIMQVCMRSDHTVKVGMHKDVCLSKRVFDCRGRGVAGPCVGHAGVGRMGLAQRQKRVGRDK